MNSANPQMSGIGTGRNCFPYLLWTYIFRQAAGAPAIRQPWRNAPALAMIILGCEGAIHD